MKTFENFIKTPYLEFISESRYKNHGLNTVRGSIPILLDSVDIKYKIEYDWLRGSFVIIFYNLTNEVKNLLLQRCELLGFFPSVFRIDDEKILMSSKNLDDFIDNIKKYNIPEKFNELYIKFETWLDDLIETPKILYHVFRSIDYEKVKSYGICPKSKHKIAYHPERIYLSSDLNYIQSIINQFKIIDKKNNKEHKYSIAIIDTSKLPEEYQLLVRKDPNFNRGYYTTQNISPVIITDYYHEK